MSKVCENRWRRSSRLSGFDVFCWMYSTIWNAWVEINSSWPRDVAISSRALTTFEWSNDGNVDLDRTRRKNRSMAWFLLLSVRLCKINKIAEQEKENWVGYVEARIENKFRIEIMSSLRAKVNGNRLKLVKKLPLVIFENNSIIWEKRRLDLRNFLWQYKKKLSW